MIDSGEIEDKNKVSLFRTVVKQIVADKEETFDDDQVHENDILLQPLHNLLKKMPRHKEPFKRWKKGKDD